MLKKADATDNNTGDYHTSRATLNTTGVRRKRSPRSFSRRRTGRRGVYRWHQTPEHHPRVVGGRPLPSSGSPNDHELPPRRSASSAARRLAADRSWRTSTRPACAPDQTSVHVGEGRSATYLLHFGREGAVAGLTAASRVAEASGPRRHRWRRVDLRADPLSSVCQWALADLLRARGRSVPDPADAPEIRQKQEPRRQPCS